MTPLTPGRLACSTAWLLALLVLALGAGVLLGPALSPAEAWDALRLASPDAAALDILWRVRLPRVGLAALVGASLAVAGALFQALLRNPLADPFILGVSGGAALGGVALLVLGPLLGLGAGAVPPASFAGAGLALLALLAIAGPQGRLSPAALLLTGVVLNAFASAAIVFCASFSGLVEGGRIFLWLIGSITEVRADVAIWVAAFLALGLACALPLARALNLLALGEESAAALGIETRRIKLLLLVSTSLMVGASVAVAGLVGFVGLIVPHLLRLLLGPDHRQLLPAAALGGAAFLVICDTAVRTLPAGRELPVGALTALAGGPFFLWLLRRSARRNWSGSALPW